MTELWKPGRKSRLWKRGDRSGLPRSGLVAQWDFARGWTPLVGSFAVQNGSTAGADTTDGTLTAGYGLLCEADYALSDTLTGIDLAGNWTLGASLISNGTTPGLMSTVLSLAIPGVEDGYVAIETNPPTFSTGAEDEAIKHCNVRLHVKNGATDTYSDGEIFLATSMVRSLLLEAKGNVLTLYCRETGESCTVTAARATGAPRIGWGVCAKATLAAPCVTSLYKETCFWSRDLSAAEDARAKNQLRARWRSLDSTRASYLTMAELEDELTAQVKAKLATGFDATERANWTSRIESLSAGKNTVLWVSDGAETPKYFPSVMVVIPKFTCESVLTGAGTAPHPAFVVGSTTYDNIYVAKYLACFVKSNSKFLPLSLRGVDPAAGDNSYKTLNGNALPNTGRLNFDDAWTFGKNPGTGWHCMTNAEWAAVALLCKANVFNPRGNNNYGKDADVTSERGVPSYTYNSSGIKIGRTLAGSGPLAWTHDGTPFGIADLNGNVLEWNPGFRQYRGEIQIDTNNGMADTTNLVTLASTAWKAVLQDGTLVETVWRTGWTPAANTLLSVWNDTAADWKTYKCTTSGAVGESAPTWYAESAWLAEVTDGAAVWTAQTGDANKTLKLQPATATAGPISLVLDVTVRTTDAVGVQFKDIATSGVTVPNILKLLGIVPDGSAYTYGNDYLYWRNDASGSYAETLARRGGYWISGSNYGVFCAILDCARSYSYSIVGFRPAFVGEV
jgi:hypothetical protein